MNGEIVDQNEEGIAVDVVDNNSVTHELSIERGSWEIVYHSQDGYPDKASKRTTAGNEHVNQARRFAKFYVYRERGYETVDPMRNPDRIAALTLAVGSLEPATLETYFGDYYQQLRSHAGDADPVVEAPDIDSDAICWLEQGVTVGLDGETVASLAEQVADATVLESLEAATGGESVDADLRSDLERSLTDHGIDLDSRANAIGEALIDTVGPLRVRWKQGGQKFERTAESTGERLGRDPDVRLQMFANLYEFDSIEEFQQSLVHHLRCQIRDCYIGMGIAPPEDARVQGPGIYEYIGNYKIDDFYPAYNDTRVEIDDWQEAHTPEDLLV